MRLRCATISLLLLIAGLAGLISRVVPLTTKDVCLMLRTGYSAEAIQKDLTGRHYIGPCDAAAEKSLRDAGATPALIETLKSGSYQVSPEEVKSAQDELAAQARRRAVAVEESRKFNTLYQDQLKRTRTVAANPQPLGEATMANLLKGDLVSWKDGSINRFDDGPIGGKKLIALYFSARWCGPCKKFTPKLVEFYNRVAPQHPEFEIVFFSNDRSPAEMETYMREDHMPWPAIDYGKLSGKGALRQYEGDGIPCLVLLDPSGNIISDSHAGKTYLGPEKVLADLDTIFSKGSAATAALR